MKILTFNAGLFSLELLGIPLFREVPFLKQRLQQLPAQLQKTNADIIALQEVYKKKYTKHIIHKLKQTYPYSCHQGRNGLLILSKHKFTKTKFHKFNHTIWFEKLFVNPGFQEVKINNLTIINTHLATGALLYKHESQFTKSQQKNQVQQILNKIKNKTIVLGDLNFGPEINKENYNLTTKHLKDINTKGAPTWDPNNILNKKGSYPTSPPQRIDHIFATKDINTTNTNTIFTKPFIKTKKHKITLSDHYGIMTELK